MDSTFLMVILLNLSHLLLSFAQATPEGWSSVPRLLDMVRAGVPGVSGRTTELAALADQGYSGKPVLSEGWSPSGSSLQIALE